MITSILHVGFHLRDTFSLYRDDRIYSPTSFSRLLLNDYAKPQKNPKYNPKKKVFFNTEIVIICYPTPQVMNKLVERYIWALR